MRLSRKRGGLRREQNKEDINPLDGMANLADVMLVFACGLLVTVIAAWDVDVATQGNSPREVEGIQKQQVEEQVDRSKLQEQGTVYVDPESGKMYIVDEK